MKTQEVIELRSVEVQIPRSNIAYSEKYTGQRHELNLSPSAFDIRVGQGEGRTFWFVRYSAGKPIQIFSQEVLAQDLEADVSPVLSGIILQALMREINNPETSPFQSIGDTKISFDDNQILISLEPREPLQKAA